MLRHLTAIWQADSAFPSGSFAFSYGVEGLATLGAVSNRATLQAFAETILRQRWATFDRIAVVRAFRARGDIGALAEVDREVEAATFGEALRTGSRRNGASFLSTHARLGEERAVQLRNAVRSGGLLGHIAVMQGAIWHAMDMDEPTALATSAYVTLAGAMSAAVRLGVVGALQAQGVLGACLSIIVDLVAENVPDDAPLQSFFPMLDVASASQARADLRLFGN